MFASLAQFNRPCAPRVLRHDCMGAPYHVVRLEGADLSLGLSELELRALYAALAAYIHKLDARALEADAVPRETLTAGA